MTRRHHAWKTMKPGRAPARFNLTHENDYKQCSSFEFHSLERSTSLSLSLSIHPPSSLTPLVPRLCDIIVRPVTIRDDFHLKRIVPRLPIHWIYKATPVFFIDLTVSRSMEHSINDPLGEKQFSNTTRLSAIVLSAINDVAHVSLPLSNSPMFSPRFSRQKLKSWKRDSLLQFLVYENRLYVNH